jgi:hypothetical protein
MRLFLEFSDQGLAQLAHRLKHQIGWHRCSKFGESAVLAHGWALDHVIPDPVTRHARRSNHDYAPAGRQFLQ